VLVPVLPMEAFRTETKGIVARFMAGHIDFPEYIATTDSTFASALPRLGGNIPDVRALIMANHDTVMAEMIRRTSPIAEA
jgi:hypothetical protein